MPPAFAHMTARPFSSMTVVALIFVVLASLLASITFWLFFIRSRQHRLRASTTEIQVQIEVEKCQDATPGSAAAPSSHSSILLFPVVATRPPSTPNIQLRTLMGRHKRKSSDEAIGVSPLSPPIDDKYTELPPSPRDSQPPIRREMWLAFDSDTSLTTLHNDPLEDGGSFWGQFPLPASEDDSDSFPAVLTPVLVSGTASPASAWEPQTPPVLSPTIRARCPPVQAVTFPDSARLASVIGPARNPSPVGVKGPIEDVLKIPETESADQRSACAEGFPPPSNFVVSVFDTPPNGTPDSSFISDTGTDYEMDLSEAKAYDKRYAALINAFSPSFSHSSLGLSGSDDSYSQANFLHFHRRGSDFGNVFDDSSGDSDNSDKWPCYDNDDEWDLILRRSSPQAECSFLAI